MLFNRDNPNKAKEIAKRNKKIKILNEILEVNIKKPNIIVNYIKYMSGVDRTDQYASTYHFLRQSLNLWHKLFFGGLKICLINSYILYKFEKKKRKEIPLTRLHYLKTLHSIEKNLSPV
ncbi:hypothetical protein HZH66_010490 [Vespula vulgaris]|uniref:PiggyBac transposable element-derived protein domain-containing protein n=1 Tax=Vespula vulgaris TaxID=7454 RepID=A0A834JIH2_VESVU|nr:hypothetical protein HZH66_010490 [Vespula vulgaris]